MIIGAHAIIYSADADADRAFLRDVMGFPSVDAGGGWLVFGLPPSEVAVHPSDRNGPHELYLMCDDVEALAGTLRKQDVACTPIHEERWGRVVSVSLPGGGRLGVYEPKHPRPAPAKRRAARRGRPARKTERRRRTRRRRA